MSNKKFREDINNLLRREIIGKGGGVVSGFPRGADL